MPEISLPIDHLSYSALRLYCANQQQFFKNYVLGLWDNKCSVVALVGKAFHKTMESYYKTGNLDAAIEVGQQYISRISDAEVDWGKTGTREGAQKDLAAAVNHYINEEPDLGETLGCEVSVVTDHGFNGQPLPLPIKAITDRVTRQNGRLHLIDYKVVRSFSDPEQEDPMKIIQAMFNYLSVTAKFKEEPEDMIYLEVKVGKNRDGSQQVRPYRIEYAKQEHYKLYFTRLYADVLYELARDDRRYLPNFADQYTGKEAFDDYIAEKIDFKAMPKVNHKANLRLNIRTAEYNPSELETNETLTKEQKIKAKLAEFGIAVEMKETYTGHNVLLYTMTPARGVRMASFEKHANDIKLALEAKSVRVQAPIPGTALVGIEVNRDAQEVLPWVPELLAPDTLTIPIGEDVYGQKHSINLIDAPHILIGGTTGSGKSIFLNTIIKALSAQMGPDDLRMILVDPKRTEFVAWSDLKHLEAKILTEADDVEMTLRWVVEQMEERYERLRVAKVKNIRDYRKSFRDMPYLVIVIDELADLMLSAEKRESIENSIIRLAQKARAVGIHIVAATQRPSVDVIPGIMKANFPTQIAFMVNKRVDSTVILDQPGAEELLGKGDALIASPGIQGLLRVQTYYSE